MREIETNRNLGMLLIGFIDDNTRIHGRKIEGYPVVGGQECLEEIIKERHIEEIIVSFKKNGIKKKREIENLCRNLNVNVAVTQMRLVIT
jgi:FlaA1/EpsC-like NDP-sugar epimerase